MTRHYYVYIMANVARTLYIGVTNDLERRVSEHKQHLIPGFTARYGLTKLVYFEETDDISVAIEREKQLKGWVRRRKIGLIESSNPTWRDLAVEWWRDSDTDSSSLRSSE